MKVEIFLTRIMKQNPCLNLFIIWVVRAIVSQWVNALLKHNNVQELLALGLASEPCTSDMYISNKHWSITEGVFNSNRWQVIEAFEAEIEFFYF